MEICSVCKLKYILPGCQYCKTILDSESQIWVFSWRYDWLSNLKCVLKAYIRETSVSSDYVLITPFFAQMWVNAAFGSVLWAYFTDIIHPRRTGFKSKEQAKLDFYSYKSTFAYEDALLLSKKLQFSCSWTFTGDLHIKINVLCTSPKDTEMEWKHWTMYSTYLAYLYVK